jgi:RHS repeat-associated protein
MEWDEWGNCLLDTTPGFQPFGFAGSFYDPDLNLHHQGAREYDPTVGRWLQPDPLGLEGGLNLYAYCANDPVNYIDYSGADPIAIIYTGGSSAAFQGNATWKTKRLLISQGITPIVITNPADLRNAFLNGGVIGLITLGHGTPQSSCGLSLKDLSEMMKGTNANPLSFLVLMSCNSADMLGKDPNSGNLADIPLKEKYFVYVNAGYSNMCGLPFTGSLKQFLETGDTNIQVGWKPFFDGIVGNGARALEAIYKKIF